MSATEPELGLGEVKTISGRTLTVIFRAANETRQYVTDSAPLRRAAFRVGDTIRTRDRKDLTVDAVAERDGLLFYQAGAREIPEQQLSDTLSFSGPTQRLFAGHLDASATFDLRRTALHHQHRRRQSSARGFLGGRIDLLPHQLSIAAEVTQRLTPRVLLADEVGLGKTIEACLILHRLILTGRVSRALIVVPESLVHQWFVELLRRFNLWFHIFNEGRSAAIEDAQPGTNPFLENQLILCDLTFLTREERRLQQSIDAGWDVVVVDEAHHLQWTPQAASAEYLAIETLGRRVPGLLLLTATPEQLGLSGHFARLRLLDPDRFHDFEAFERETEGYRAIASLAQALLSGEPLTTAQALELSEATGESPPALTVALAKTGEEAATLRRSWLDRLLDRHGTGRVMFRNTRATVAGFPRRVAHLHAIAPAGDAAAVLKALSREWEADITGRDDTRSRPQLSGDPRMDWLAGLLRSLGDEKVLLICRTTDKALAIEAALKQRTTIAAGVFHERLSLVQRDRSAASFGERHGLRLLICSEIGSEGRNFQFAHHLVLFDLPRDPGILEQRIGRLDRIGQRADIHVHVPFVPGSPQEAMARWYHEGLNVLTENFGGVREVQERFIDRLLAVARRMSHDRPGTDAALQALLDEAAIARREATIRLEAGRDRLLEWNSLRPEVASALLATIRGEDASLTLADFMLKIFDHYFIEVEEIAPRTYRLGSAGVLRDTFPGLTSEGLTITADRTRALAREELQFLTWDHPLVSGAFDLLLGSDHGSCGFARWADAQVSGLYLEAIYMLETVAPPSLHVDRFLPATPIQVAVDHRGRDAREALASATLSAAAHESDGRALLRREDIRAKALPRMLERTAELANAQRPPIIERAIAAARATLDHEIARLEELRKVNRSIRGEEITALGTEQLAITDHIGAARLRLDAIRLIHRGPVR